MLKVGAVRFQTVFFYEPLRQNFRLEEAPRAETSRSSPMFTLTSPFRALEFTQLRARIQVSTCESDALSPASASADSLQLHLTGDAFFWHVLPV